MAILRNIGISIILSNKEYTLTLTYEHNVMSHENSGYTLSYRFA